MTLSLCITIFALGFFSGFVFRSFISWRRKEATKRSKGEHLYYQPFMD